MARLKTLYVCSNCGYESAKWYGKCPSCNEWNSMNEETVREEPARARSASTSVAVAESIQDISIKDEHRYRTGINEFDRVLGGGIVRGSLVLLGGDPGIGKSTIMLQICNHIAHSKRVLYVSGEESPRQIRLRADRLGVTGDNLSVMAQTDVQSVCEFIQSDKPDFVVVDSIQTMSLSEVSSSPGSVSQVRECTNMLLRTAKGCDIPIFIVGHVNKDGAIAGPKVEVRPFSGGL